MDLFGQDIRIDMSTFQPVVAADGSLQLTDGEATGVQDVWLRLATVHEHLFYDRTYGSLIHEWVLDESTPSRRLALEVEIVSRVRLDPRVIPGSVSCKIKAWDTESISLELKYTFTGSDNPQLIVLRVSKDSDSNTLKVEAVGRDIAL